MGLRRPVGQGVRGVSGGHSYDVKSADADLQEAISTKLAPFVQKKCVEVLGVEVRSLRSD